MEVRCPQGKLFGVIVAEGVLEVKCDSKFCGHQPGLVVLHQIDLSTGRTIHTKRYRSPQLNRRDNDPS